MSTNAMQSDRFAKTRRRHPRPLCRGLATLEMVLALPILLGLMALMVNFGTIASWKVRTLTAARNALWTSRHHRTASLASDPRPRGWPQSAAIGHGGAERVDALDDARVDLPVARGPSISVSRGALLPPVVVIVNRELLDPTVGLHAGWAELDRKFPMLASLGKYHLASHQRLFDNPSAFRGMGLRFDYSYRAVLRLDTLYRLPKADPVYAIRYVEAIVALWQSPCWGPLRALDRDAELRRAFGRYIDFHPILPRDRPVTEVDERVRTLINERIPAVPNEMEARFTEAQALLDGH